LHHIDESIWYLVAFNGMPLLLLHVLGGHTSHLRNHQSLSHITFLSNDSKTAEADLRFLSTYCAVTHISLQQPVGPNSHSSRFRSATVSDLEGGRRDRIGRPEMHFDLVFVEPLTI
jgi:hypothetical protein